MSHIGSYKIPFPFEPYPLQQHALIALREFLENNDKESWSHRNYNVIHEIESETSRESRSLLVPAHIGWKVAVLESPTGTGKSQILLNSVLSFLFYCLQPEMLSLRTQMTNINNNNCRFVEYSSVSSKTTKQEQNKLETDAPMTLEQAIVKQSKLLKRAEDKREMRRQLRKRKHALPAQRRRVESNCQYHVSNLNKDNTNDMNLEDEFLIAQGVNGNQQLIAGENNNEMLEENKIISAHSIMSMYSSSSSEDEYSSTDSEFDKSNKMHVNKLFSEEGDKEQQQQQQRQRQEVIETINNNNSSSSSVTNERRCESIYDDDDDGDDGNSDKEEISVSRLVPLRKPKIYFASRTHTQLEQLFADLQITNFAKQRVVRRRFNVEESEQLSSISTDQCGKEEKNNVQQTNKTIFLERATQTEAVVETTTLSKTKLKLDNPTFKKEEQDHEMQYCLETEQKKKQESEGNCGVSHSCYLNAVHVAGRNHLCINNAVRQRAAGNGSLLNELCAEAMKYERSPEGRRARREQANSLRSMTTSKLTHHTSFLSMPNLHSRSSMSLSNALIDVVDVTSNNTRENTHVGWEAKSTLQDLEDLATEFPQQYVQQQHKVNELLEEQQQQQQEQPHINNLEALPKGCEFCALHRVRALVEYVRKQQQQSGKFISMEEMIKLGEELRGCPYLATRCLLRGADVVFIPYAYLVDEEQREHLLGGTATNPVCTSEVHELQNSELLAEALRKKWVQQGSSSGNGTKQNHSNLLADSSENIVSKCKTSTLTISLPQCRSHRSSINLRKQRKLYKKETSDEDLLIEEKALNAPASLDGDIVVIDEAHNITDYCRSLSTSYITTNQLRLIHLILHKYTAVYEKRLLSRNKQRLRELCALIDKLLGYTNNFINCLTTTTAISSSLLHSKESDEKTITRVLSFNDWVFDAKIDYIDMYPLLIFVEESMLYFKLPGFVSSILRKEFNNITAYKLKERELKNKQTIREYKNRKLSNLLPQEEQFYEEQEKSDNLETAWNRNNLSLKSCGGRKQNIECKFGQWNESNTDLKEEMLLTALWALEQNKNNITEVADIDAFVRFHSQEVSRAFQQLVHFIRWFYKSDSSTRVLVETLKTEKNNNNTYSYNTNSISQVDAKIKLIQLEPGQHTLAPLIKQAYAIILAGGTMEPLQLTVHPLLPLHTSSSFSSSLLTSHKSVTPVAVDTNVQTQESATSDHVCVIKEGHIISSSSVVVYTLSVGPSNTKLCFSHRAMEKEASEKKFCNNQLSVSSTTSESTNTLFNELSMTLLNFARVLPPAGVICFFTSHEIEARFVQYLLSSNYYKQINEVKRIFSIYTFTTSEYNTNVSNNMNGNSNKNTETLEVTQTTLPDKVCFTQKINQSAETLADMLVAYKHWIYGDTHSSTVSSTRSEAKEIRRGAFLFTVMGGRLSEGINFADDLARAVLVVGLPFANAQNVELQLYLKHIANKQAQQTGNHSLSLSSPLSSAMTSSDCFTSSMEWDLYTDLCMRVVNQCIGRCIRHINDYAAIILIDSRYGERVSLQRKLASWLQPSLHISHNFGECFRGTRGFFQDIAQKRSSSEKFSVKTITDVQHERLHEMFES